MTNILSVLRMLANGLLGHLIPKGLKAMQKNDRRNTIYRMVFYWILMVTLFVAVSLNIIDWETVEEILQIIIPYGD